MARFEKSKTKKGIRPIYVISHTEISNNITEFKCLDSEKMCLNPILDLYNGEVISFGVSNRPTLDFVLKSLNEVLETIENEAEYGTTIHSDHGWPYKHQKWVKTLENHRVFQRMSRKATSADNAAMENFFGILKQEIYYG